MNYFHRNRKQENSVINVDSFQRGKYFGLIMSF